MEIHKKQDGNALEIALEGRLDTMTAPQLEAELFVTVDNKPKFAFDGVTELVIDLAKLDYISSAGLRVLLSAQKAMSKLGSMTVRNANEDLMEVFEVTGFVDILNIE